METRFHFRHMPVSEALQTFVRDKFSHIEALISDQFPIHVSISQDHENWEVKVSCHAPDKHLIEVSAKSDEVHKSVDLIVDKLAKALRRRKSKMVQKRHTDLGHQLDQAEAEKQLMNGVMSNAIDAQELEVHPH